MENQIIIKTDDAGVKLNETVIKGLNFYASHLDDLNKWNSMVDQLAAIRDSSPVKFEVDFSVIKNLISIDSLLSISLSDLHIITNELYLSKVKLQQIFYIKQAHLIVYETFKNLKIQQSFLSISVFGLGGTLLSDFKEWIKIKKAFLKKYKVESTVKTVRNKLVGHIDTDFKLWYEAANSLDAAYTATMIIEYINMLAPLQRLANELIDVFRKELEIGNEKLRASNFKFLSELEADIEKSNDENIKNTIGNYILTLKNLIKPKL